MSLAPFIPSFTSKFSTNKNIDSTLLVHHSNGSSLSLTSSPLIDGSFTLDATYQLIANLE